MSWDQKLTQLFFFFFSFFKSRYVCAAGTGCWHSDGPALTLLKVYLAGSQRVKRDPHLSPPRGEQGGRRLSSLKGRRRVNLSQCSGGWTWAVTLLLGQRGLPLPDSRHLQSRAGTQNPIGREFKSRTVFLYLLLSLEHREFPFLLISSHFPLFLSRSPQV